MPLTERLSSRVAAEALALAGSEPRGVPAVIDTNVVLDLIYWEDPHSEDLRRALEEGRIHALRSGEAVMELAEVLSRPAFAGDEDEAARLAALWCSMSVPVDEEKIREAADVITVQCRDPLDQKFFTLTLAGGASMDESRDTKTAVVRYVLAQPMMQGKRVLMVGDRNDDMRGAADCGLDAAGALYGYGSREELAPFHPVLLAESCADLADQLLEQRA